VKAGDRFVLGTDGLFGDVPGDALHAAARAADPAVAAELLVGLAIEAGGRDNITTLVVEVLSPNDDERPDDESTTPRNAAGSEFGRATVEVETTQPRPQAVGLLERDADRPRSGALWSDREGDG
jgi:serine/threonine protein phosphatase PrpC